MTSSIPTTDGGMITSLEPSNQPMAQDAVMADAPPVNISENQPHRTVTPQRNGSSATPAVPQPAVPQPTEATLPSKAAPHGARCRQYLNEKITPTLLAGMKQIAAEQPEDPLRMLGEFLLAKSRETEGSISRAPQ